MPDEFVLDIWYIALLDIFCFCSLEKMGKVLKNKDRRCKSSTNATNITTMLITGGASTGSKFGTVCTIRVHGCQKMTPSSRAVLDTLVTTRPVNMGVILDTRVYGGRAVSVDTARGPVGPARGHG